MRKLLFISLLLIATLCKAQGIKMKGVAYTDLSTGNHIDSLFTYVKYQYNSLDSMVVLSLPLSNSVSNAQTNNYIQFPEIYRLPRLYFEFKSTIGYPNSTSLFNTVKPLLQNQYGFTVTTF